MRLAALFLMVSAGFAQDATPPKNVVLFGWDGAQREHVVQLLVRGKLPTLTRVARAGNWVEIEIEGATQTKAGWAEILTGYGPDVTGVYSNRRYRPIPPGLTIFERCAERFGKGYATLAVMGKKGNVGAGAPRRLRLDLPANRDALRKQGWFPEGRFVTDRDGVRWWVRPGEPYWHTRKTMTLFENGLGRNEVVGKRAIEVLERHRNRPFFFFVHFADSDRAGHKWGENSQEYEDALASNDLWTGRVLDALARLGLARNTLVYITADHGFDEGGRSHLAASHVFLATNDPAVRRGGKRPDVAATIYDALGLEKFDPPLAGKSLRRRG